MQLYTKLIDELTFSCKLAIASGGEDEVGASQDVVTLDKTCLFEKLAYTHKQHTVLELSRTQQVKLLLKRQSPGHEAEPP